MQKTDCLHRLSWTDQRSWGFWFQCRDHHPRDRLHRRSLRDHLIHLGHRRRVGCCCRPGHPGPGLGRRRHRGFLRSSSSWSDCSRWTRSPRHRRRTRSRKIRRPPSLDRRESENVGEKSIDFKFSLCIILLFKKKSTRKSE